MIFFVLNLTLGFSLLLLKIWIGTNQLNVLFQIFSEIIFFYPFICLGFLLLSIGLYFIAVFLGGKASFSQFISVMGLSSFPFIVIFIPQLTLIAILVWTFFLISSFQQIHRYSFQKAVINVAFPFLVISSFMLAVGILNLSFMMSTISSLLE